MSDPAFAGAGKQAGLELWRIEKLAPVKQPKVSGKFHVGDSYILLSTTTTRSGSLAWTIHFWLGAETSQDEAGVAAYKTVELDSILGGTAAQYREVQGNESSLFLSFFKNTGGIEYLPGGVESGFKHVGETTYETRLLHLKGKRTVRVTQVPLSKRSLNKGDVFILDAGLTIYIFNGLSANTHEKAKGVEVASNINSDQRMGRAQIVVVNDDIRNEGFWGPLGGFVDPASLPDGESDEIVSASKTQTRLFRVSGDGKAVDFAEIPLDGGKLKRSQLDSGDVFVVVTSKVFIWVGQRSSLEEKREAFPKTLAFMKQNNIPANTPVERVADGNESSAFKAEFSEWNPPVSFAHVSKETARAEDTPIDVAAVLSRKAIEDTPVDDGSGKLKIWVIQNFGKVELPISQYGQFYGGDSYLLLYTYVKNRKENFIIYFWLGRDSTTDEQGTAALLATELDNELGGSPVQIRVTQGKEPPHFRQLFQGKLIIHSGGRASGFKNSSESSTMNASGIALFHVRGSNALNTYAVEVRAEAASLNSEDSFVLVTPGIAYVWTGSGTNSSEIAVASNIANVLRESTVKGCDVITITEGREPAEFWVSLGGKAEYSKLAPGEAVPRDPRLFEASTVSGSFKLVEIDNFDQTDLNDEDVYILDTYTQVFVWVGSQSTAEEKAKGSEVAKRFISEASDGRDSGVSIVVVQAGSEPIFFTSHFHSWDPDYAKKHTFVDPYAAKLEALAAANAKKGMAGEASSIKLRKTEVPAKSAPAAVAEPAPVAMTSVEPQAPSYKTPAETGLFSLEVLKTSVPPGVNPSLKEEYLVDAEFASAFGCDKKAFAAQPKWKRDQKKKDLGIF